MKIAIINPITQTLNYPTEKEPATKPETDEYCNIIELAQSISQHGNKLTVFASDSFRPTKTINGKKKGLTVKYLPTKLKTIFHPAVLPYCPKIPNEIKKGDFDAIIATDNYQISTIQAALAKQERTKLLLWQELDREFKPFAAKQIQEAYHKTLFKRIERKIDLLVPRSNSAGAFLEKICKNKDKISKPIPTPVNTEFFKPKKTKTENFVLDVTRLNKDKGLGFLLETIEETKKALPEQLFIVAGSGPEKNWLEKEAKKRGLSKNIAIKSLPRKEMPALYNKSSLTIIHSKGGLLPFAALEAMACAKTVVSSFKGALLDLIEENKNGFFVSTPKETAERIVFLLENKRRTQCLGQNARKKIEKSFSMQTVAKKFVKAIEEIQ